VYAISYSATVFLSESLIHSYLFVIQKKKKKKTLIHKGMKL